METDEENKHFVQFRGFNFHLFEILHSHDNTSEVSRCTKLLCMTSESKKKKKHGLNMDYRSMSLCMIQRQINPYKPQKPFLFYFFKFRPVLLFTNKRTNKQKINKHEKYK